MLILTVIHGRIKFIQESVFQQRVVHQIPLSAGVVVRFVIANTWEIQPLRMTKFVS